jgi:hypothetical protein
MFIAGQPANSKPPASLESRRDDLKIAQGKASLRAPPWVNVPKISFPLSPSEGERDGVRGSSEVHQQVLRRRAPFF